MLSKSASTLEELVINNNNISDLSPLNKCEKLHTLSADNNGILFADVISSFSALKVISLQSNKFNSIGSLDNLKGVTHLDLSGNNLVDTESLKNIEFDKYAFLDLSNNKISSMTLPPNSIYNTLAIHGNNIKNIEQINNLSANKILFNYSENIDFSKIKKDNFNDFYLVNCPLDKRLSVEEALGGAQNVTHVTPDEADNTIKDTNEHLFHYN